ncbi:Cytochrome P450 [Macrophomina phaseolina MS6]|uniref:Cytochrome P450 n=1 Tax=Macrophomina phaseolina (strain MS6) TaxID=1126212 RepID=K2QMJ9_MACPH|nr:Cytochrome P450 [Macrophomina phaseolina MS6]
MQFYAFDVIGSITTGSPFGLLEKGYDDGIIADIHDVVYYGTFTGIFPKLHWWIQKTLHLLKPFGLLSSRQALVHFMLFHAEQRRKGITSNDKNDFLTKLLKLEEDGQNTRADTFNALGNNIIAGSDTTSITLSAVIYYLIKNPSKMARPRREIDQKAAEGALSDPITFQQSQNMPYLQEVIKETLRIHPAVAFILARRVPPGGATVCGKFLPQDVSGPVTYTRCVPLTKRQTDVGINAWVAHQNAQVFPEPTQFIPERWLGPKESVAKMEAYFSAVRQPHTLEFIKADKCPIWVRFESMHWKAY